MVKDTKTNPDGHFAGLVLITGQPIVGTLEHPTRAGQDKSAGMSGVAEDALVWSPRLSHAPDPLELGHLIYDCLTIHTRCGSSSGKAVLRLDEVEPPAGRAISAGRLQELGQDCGNRYQ